MSKVGPPKHLAGIHPKWIMHTIGLTSGTFDLFHYMHLEYLQRCRRTCDFLVVGVDSDHLVRERKGESRPYMTASERAAIVANLKCVDRVFVMERYQDFWDVVEQLKPKVIYKNKPFGKDHPELFKCHVEIISDKPDGISTSALVERIRK